MGEYVDLYLCPECFRAEGTGHKLTCPSVDDAVVRPQRRQRFHDQLAALAAQERDDGPDAGYVWTET